MNSPINKADMSKSKLTVRGPRGGDLEETVPLLYLHTKNLHPLDFRNIKISEKKKQLQDIFSVHRAASLKPFEIPIAELF